MGTVHFKLDEAGNGGSKIISLLAIDEDYFPLMQMQFIEGHNFRKESGMDRRRGIIINEAGIRFLGLGDSVVGKFVSNVEIIGVLKNGNFNSLHSAAKPVVFSSGTNTRGYMNIKLNTSDVPSAMAFIKSTYNRIFDEIPFQASFLDQDVEAMYRDDINQGRLLTIFTLLSIILANIGLFGLITIMSHKRTKEIGIRKANGALTWQIVMLLSSRLLTWLLISIVIAVPASWYIIDRWLQNFAARTYFSWWIIPLGGLIILISALLTTGVITYRAAVRNPVDTLRYE